MTTFAQLGIDDELVAMFKQRPNLVLTPNLPDRGVKTDPGWLRDSLSDAEFKKLQAAAVDRTAHVVLTKRIPAGAGLGVGRIASGRPRLKAKGDSDAGSGRVIAEQSPGFTTVVPWSYVVWPYGPVATPPDIVVVSTSSRGSSPPTGCTPTFSPPWRCRFRNAAVTASSPLAASPTTSTASFDIDKASRNPSRVTG